MPGKIVFVAVCGVTKTVKAWKEELSDGEVVL